LAELRGDVLASHPGSNLSLRIRNATKYAILRQRCFSSIGCGLPEIRGRIPRVQGSLAPIALFVGWAGELSRQALLPHSLANVSAAKPFGRPSEMLRGT